jgi:hypothetical protein
MRRDIISYPRAWAGDTSLRSCTRSVERRSRIASDSFHLCAHCRVGRLRRKVPAPKWNIRRRKRARAGRRNSKLFAAPPTSATPGAKNGRLCNHSAPDLWKRQRCAVPFKWHREQLGSSTGIPPPFLLPAIDGRNDAPLARPPLLEGGPKLSRIRRRLRCSQCGGKRIDTRPASHTRQPDDPAYP